MGTLTISMAIYAMAMLNNQMVCFIFWGLSIHQTFHNAKKRGFDQQKWWFEKIVFFVVDRGVSLGHQKVGRRENKHTFPWRFHQPNIGNCDLLTVLGYEGQYAKECKQ